MATISVRIDIAVDEGDAEAVEFAAGDLREELLSLDVDAVQAPRAGQPPTSAKAGAELAVVGALLLTVPDSALLSAIAEIIKSWIGRSSGRSARLEIDGDVLDVKGLSSSEQQLLIKQWLLRHNSSNH